MAKAKKKTKLTTLLAFFAILLFAEYSVGNLREIHEHGFLTALQSLWSFVTQATDWQTVCSTFQDEIEWKFLAVTQSTRIQECLFLLSIAGILKVCIWLWHTDLDVKGFAEKAVRAVRQCGFWMNALYVYAMYGVLPSDCQSSDVFLSSGELVGGYAASSERTSILDLDDIRMYDMTGSRVSLPGTHAKLIWDRHKPQVVLVCSREFLVIENGRASKCSKTVFTAGERRKTIKFADCASPMTIEV